MSILGVLVFICATLVLGGAGALVLWRTRFYAASVGGPPAEAEAEAGADPTEFMTLADLGIEPPPEAPLADGTQLVDMVSIVGHERSG